MNSTGQVAFSILSVSALVVGVVALQVAWGWCLARWVIVQDHARVSGWTLEQSPSLKRPRRWIELGCFCGWVIENLASHWRVPGWLTLTGSCLLILSGLTLSILGISFHWQEMRKTGRPATAGRLYHAASALGWGIALAACLVLSLERLSGHP